MSTQTEQDYQDRVLGALTRRVLTVLVLGICVTGTIVGCLGGLGAIVFAIVWAVSGGPARLIEDHDMRGFVLVSLAVTVVPVVWMLVLEARKARR